MTIRGNGQDLNSMSHAVLNYGGQKFLCNYNISSKRLHTVSLLNCDLMLNTFWCTDMFK